MTRFDPPAMTLVTGATGRVGRRLVDALLARRAGVRGLARTADQARQLEAQAAEAMVGKLNDAQSLERGVCGVQGVVHLAVTPTGNHTG
jgi:uncharacterized protein YbjT (DUF2867 family)